VMIVPTRDGVAFSVTINLAPRPFSPRRGEKVAEGRMRGAPHPRFADPLPAPRGEGARPTSAASSPQQRPASFAGSDDTPAGVPSSVVAVSAPRNRRPSLHARAHR
jgi:hypothetical protein